MLGEFLPSSIHPIVPRGSSKRVPPSYQIRTGRSDFYLSYHRYTLQPAGFVCVRHFFCTQSVTSIDVEAREALQPTQTRDQDLTEAWETLEGLQYIVDLFEELKMDKLGADPSTFLSSKPEEKGD
eukprot:TRINITY_DN1010_c0_g1_i5.p1 TRINITY_DN1010_c0_g1~~TRINITY_DN1010_c0_g1_i5.p1  ORF type:complete len:125 (+),score=4.07 TRINITY_DN1010_c0_g1_i5:304-678(+)